MDWINLGIIQLYLYKRVIVKQETKKKRNETKQAETKRNTTETKQDKAETKRNETRHNRNETIFFHMRQQFTKWQWWIEKPLKFTGRFGYGRKK